MAKEKGGLYFLALIPEEPAFSEIRDIRLEISKEYNSVRALRTPPHITIIPPFSTNPGKLANLISLFGNLALQFQPIKIELTSFGTFPGVIFLDVPLEEYLKSIYQACREKFIAGGFEWTWPRPFHPHITMAFRDLGRDDFKRASQNLKSLNQPVEAIFKSLSLLELLENRWEVIAVFPFPTSFR